MADWLQQHCRLKHPCSPLKTCIELLFQPVDSSAHCCKNQLLLELIKIPKVERICKTTHPRHFISQILHGILIPPAWLPPCLRDRGIPSMGRLQESRTAANLGWTSGCGGIPTPIAGTLGMTAARSLDRICIPRRGGRALMVSRIGGRGDSSACCAPWRRRGSRGGVGGGYLIGVFVAWKRFCVSFCNLGLGYLGLCCCITSSVA